MNTYNLLTNKNLSYVPELFRTIRYTCMLFSIRNANGVLCHIHMSVIATNTLWILCRPARLFLFSCTVLPWQCAILWWNSYFVINWYRLTEISVCVNNHVHYSISGAISHTCLDFDRQFELKIGHYWAITSHCFTWMSLFCLVYNNLSGSRMVITCVTCILSWLALKVYRRVINSLINSST